MSVTKDAVLNHIVKQPLLSDKNLIIGKKVESSNVDLSLKGGCIS